MMKRAILEVTFLFLWASVLPPIAHGGIILDSSGTPQTEIQEWIVQLKTVGEGVRDVQKQLSETPGAHWERVEAAKQLSQQVGEWITTLTEYARALPSDWTKPGWIRKSLRDRCAEWPKQARESLARLREACKNEISTQTVKTRFRNLETRVNGTEARFTNFMRWYELLPKGGWFNGKPDPRVEKIRGEKFHRLEDLVRLLKGFIKEYSWLHQNDRYVSEPDSCLTQVKRAESQADEAERILSEFEAVMSERADAPQQGKAGSQSESQEAGQQPGVSLLGESSEQASPTQRPMTSGTDQRSEMRTEPRSGSVPREESLPDRISERMTQKGRRSPRKDGPGGLREIVDRLGLRMVDPDLLEAGRNTQITQPVGGAEEGDDD